MVYGKGCILVLETDELIRELLVRWLGDEGFGVLARPPGARLARGQSIRLVIADLSDPRHADAQIAALKSMYGAPVLALSARFRRGLGGSREAAQRLEVSGTLPKPFTRAELLAAVREALA